MIHGLAEWKQYTDSLMGADLRSKAIAANTQGFADTLLGEGVPMRDIQTVLLFFARRLAADGQKLPENGAFDFAKLLLLDQSDPRATVF
mgnify:CR=1 FL=1